MQPTLVLVAAATLCPAVAYSGRWLITAAPATPGSLNYIRRKRPDLVVTSGDVSHDMGTALSDGRRLWWRRPPDLQRVDSLTAATAAAAAGGSSDDRLEVELWRDANDLWRDVRGDVHGCETRASAAHSRSKAAVAAASHRLDREQLNEQVVDRTRAFIGENEHCAEAVFSAGLGFGAAAGPPARSRFSDADGSPQPGVVVEIQFSSPGARYATRWRRAYPSKGKWRV